MHKTETKNIFLMNRSFSAPFKTKDLINKPKKRQEKLLDAFLQLYIEKRVLIF